ncbi:YhcN/YlaJ family sporulation lipoprotein [Paenibacillus sp. M1]|uniref:YhcN/YlaJ family sporulation lipoprotein n=1 Tax=Paenibacillus haidiansis TaxID=1574488 RepID=A0ABU7VP65_9BACL
MSLLTSCATATKKASPSPQNQTNVPRVQSTTDGSMNVNNNGILPAKARQAHIEELVRRVPGVKGAHCVVMGKTAVVGIDVDSKLERARVGSIKYTVAEALRKDPQGAGALVTADIDLNQRIKEMGNKVAQGKPISGFATEMADIIGRIVPQLPSDVKPRTTTPAVQGTKQTGTSGKGNVTPKSNMAPNGNRGTKHMEIAPGR